MGTGITEAIRRLEPSLKRVLVLGALVILIVSGLILGSSLIEHGHGFLGLSETVSLAILGPVLLAGLGFCFALVSRATSGDLNDPPFGAGSVVRRKCDFSSEEWFELLEEAEKEFYIAGHSMASWCGASSEGRFTEELEQLLLADGRVTLVMLALESPQRSVLQQATQIDYGKKIEVSQRVLGDLERTLDADLKTRLRITTLLDHTPLPYMVVGNERRLVTATYLSRTDSDFMPCLDLDRKSDAGRAIYDGFHKMAGSHGSTGHTVTPGGILSRLRRQR